MTPDIRVGMTATRAPWGTAFRAFVRDHAAGVTVETLMSASQLPEPGQRALDVLIVDDQMPMLKAGHIAAAKDRGTVAIGLWDETTGRGRDHVIELGVDEPLPASTSPAELLQVVLRVGPVNAGYEPIEEALDYVTRSGRQPGPPGSLAGPFGANRSHRARRATITNFSSVCGGAGETEALVAVAEHIAVRAKILVVEGGGATLAQRLRRAPEYGLAWSLERIAAGHRAFPGGLSPARDDGARPLGRSDVICGTTAPAGPPPVSALHLGYLLDQAAMEYDHVLVETGALSTPSVVLGGDRFAIARAVLSRADQVVVFASADPCGATRLVEWRAVVHRDLELAVPCVAVFGRAPQRRFERSALEDVLDRNTGRASFASVRFLPEDPAVGRARWNGEMVTRGPWYHATAGLAADIGDARSTRPAPDQAVSNGNSTDIGREPHRVARTVRARP